jgi:hypothetical protein
MRRWHLRALDALVNNVTTDMEVNTCDGTTWKWCRPCATRTTIIHDPSIHDPAPPGFANSTALSFKHAAVVHSCDTGYWIGGGRRWPTTARCRYPTGGREEVVTVLRAIVRVRAAEIKGGKKNGQKVRLGLERSKWSDGRQNIGNDWLAALPCSLLAMID